MITVDLCEHEARALRRMANLWAGALDGEGIIPRIECDMVPEGHVISPLVSASMKLEAALLLTGREA